MENEWSSRVTDRRHTIPGGTDRAGHAGRTAQACRKPRQLGGHRCGRQFARSSREVARTAELLGYHIRKTAAYQVAENNFSLTTTFSQFPRKQIEDHLANLDPAVRAQVQAVRQWQVLEWAAQRALKADEAFFGASDAIADATQRRGQVLWFRVASNATSALASATQDSPFSAEEIRKHFGGENDAFRNKIEEALLEAFK